jgi:hypothetical protein
MKHRDIIFCLFLQIALALALLTLSMSAHASSNSHMHNQAVGFGPHAFASGAEENARHGEEINHGEKAGEHFYKNTGHEISHKAKDHMDHDHQEEIPLAYLFYWGILILVMVIILIYFVSRHKNKHSEPMIPLAVFLVLFALSIYILEIISPVFSGRFDTETLRIVHEFHEAPDLGFLRFFYKFILGIFMTVFAFLNLNRKGLNQKTMDNKGER